MPQGKLIRASRLLTLAWLTLLVSACGTQPIQRPSSSARADSAKDRKAGVRSQAPDYQEGYASWYGKRFKGRKTASGARFDPKQLTAAHRTYPFGSKLQVSCPRTGKSVIVTVNDRGPFSGHRVLDISRAAARQLGILGAGVAWVQIRKVD